MAGVIWIVALVLASFTVAYFTYGRYLSQFVELDDSRDTPAHKYEDGQEYVPAKKPVLLGHHYSSIAGGAPIVGPITAAMIWGWVPAFLWVAIGNPLLGAVHDFTSLSSSLRHEGKSIGYIIGEYVGERGKDMLLWFAFLLIILVVAVFALVISLVFTVYPSAATASLIYITLALLFGVWLYQFDLPFSVGTVVFVAGVFASVYIGVEYPLALFGTGDTYPLTVFGTEQPFPGASDDVLILGGDAAPGFIPELIFDGTVGKNVGAWLFIILVYGGVASILPVWMLLQPRDYLSSFLLYTGVGGTLLAVIVGTFITGIDATGLEGQALDLSIELDMWYGFTGDGGPFADSLPLMPLFPLLFVTIACGTISGFHSLVSSGTTAKQLDRETDARLIGYGGMLGEGLLAAVAISTVAIVAIPSSSGGIALALPNFAAGGGALLTAFGLSTNYAAPFMALVLASFLLTSMDTACRLGRYMMEEIVGTPETTAEEYAANKYVNTGVILIVSYVLVSTGRWEDLWPLFGGANQLLAAMALLTATVWVANWDETKQLVSTGVPMALMAATTIAALLWLAIYQVTYLRILGEGSEPFEGTVEYLAGGVQVVLALVLVGLALALLKLGYGNISEIRDFGGERVAADGSGESDD